MRNQVSGSYQVNPTPKSYPIKDQAKFHKKVSTKTVRQLINESLEDTAKPKASNL